jgi:hypothetical protein
VNAPASEWDKAFPEYFGKVLTGGAGLSIAGILGLFAPKPGDKKKKEQAIAAAETQSFQAGKRHGIDVAKGAIMRDPSVDDHHTTKALDAIVRNA